MRREPSSCMGNRHVRRGERKVAYGDINNLYGTTMSQCLLEETFHEIEIRSTNCSQKNTLQRGLKKYKN